MLTVFQVFDERRAMSKPHVPLATHDFVAGEVDVVFEFLKRMRSEMRMLRKVRETPASRGVGLESRT